MVDVLAIAASWRMWAAEQGSQGAEERAQLMSEHARSLDAVHEAVAAERCDSKRLDSMESRDLLLDRDASCGAATASDGAASAELAPGVAQVAPAVQHMLGVQAAPLAAVSWAASVACAGHFLKEAHGVTLRLMQCAVEAGPALVFMAGQFHVHGELRGSPRHCRLPTSLPRADTAGDGRSSTVCSAASMDGREDALQGLGASSPAGDDGANGCSHWPHEDSRLDFPHALGQVATERNLDSGADAACDSDDARPGTPPWPGARTPSALPNACALSRVVGGAAWARLLSLPVLATGRWPWPM